MALKNNPVRLTYNSWFVEIQSQYLLLQNVAWPLKNNPVRLTYNSWFVEIQSQYLLLQNVLHNHF